MASAFAGGRLPAFERGAFGFFVVAAVASALLGDRAIGQWLVLDPRDALVATPWQVWTANFVFPEGQMAGLLGTLLLQWFAGSDVERQLGTWRYLALCVSAGTLGYLASAGVAAAWGDHLALVPVGGTTPVDLAAVASFGLLAPRRSVQLFGVLPLSARGMAVLVVGVSWLGSLARADALVRLIPDVFAVLVAAAWLWFRGRGAKGSGFRGPTKSGKVGRHKKGSAPRLRVVDGGPSLLN